MCLGHLRTLAVAAEAQGSYLWIDMEDSAYVDRTLDLYQRLRATHPSTGDLPPGVPAADGQGRREAPARWAPPIRLVKGAYDEPKAIAFRSKKEVDANFLGLAVTLIRESRVRPDAGRASARTTSTSSSRWPPTPPPPAIPKDAFEVQMLYGVRAKEQKRLAKAGFNVQVLIAYGDAWYRWYMRRLAERPANVLFAIRQLLPW